MGVFNSPTLQSERLILRKFEKSDIEALFLLLQDEEVNTFLPWFPARSTRDAAQIYERKFAGVYRQKQGYAYAVCLKTDDFPIGYIQAETDESRDLGYALRKEYWHRGIISEAGRVLIQRLREDGVPYITATHDVKNPRSGGVMKALGMRYRYSYKEQWQPKNIPVVFRMYQLNLDGEQDRVYTKYRERYEHFIESGV